MAQFSKLQRCNKVLLCKAFRGVPRIYNLLWFKSQSEIGGCSTGFSHTPDYTSTKTILEIDLLLLQVNWKIC